MRQASSRARLYRTRLSLSAGARYRTRLNSACGYGPVPLRRKAVARVLTESELLDFPSLEWADVAPRLDAQIRNTLESVMATLDGNNLTHEQCLRLAYAVDDDLLGLLVAADFVRRELVGNIVTYVVNRNINFTNICFVGCKFCAFSRGPREFDTYFLTS